MKIVGKRTSTIIACQPKRRLNGNVLKALWKLLSKVLMYDGVAVPGLVNLKKSAKSMPIPAYITMRMEQMDQRK
jgi:hypothetical protein